MYKNNKFKILIMLLSVVVLSTQFVIAQTAVDLGTAGDFVILAKSGVSTTGTTSIVGDIGASPIDSTGITGFGLIADSSNQFATSSLVTGRIYTSDYAPPTPTTMTTAISDMETAYTDAAGRTLPDYTELGAGNIGGMTLAPGLYKWGTGVTIPTDVTLSGNSNDIWIFQIAQDLDISDGKQVILIGGAQASNIFWQVAGQATLGTTSVFNGNILGQTAIVLNTGATLNGRALAQTAVTLDASIVNLPGSANIPQGSDEENNDKGSGNTNIEITPPVNSDSVSRNGNTGNDDIKTTVISNQGSKTTVGVTEPREITRAVSGKSVTIVKNGEKIEVASINGKVRLKSGNINVETELPIESEDDTIRATKSNGIKADIKIMPSVASETAIERLRLKFCTEENSCTITLKEVGTENKLAYQVKAYKNVRVLGLFRAKMNVEANVDAETNEVISAKVPWWSSISTEY